MNDTVLEKHSFGAEVGRLLDLVVHSLYDGDPAEPGDTVMTLEGPFAAFAALETPILGTLARRTRVSTNARAFVEAARPKLVIAFPARHDHWLLQPGDAVAAQIGGALTIVGEKCLDAGMDDYIAKPVRSQTLVEVLRRWIPDEDRIRIGDCEFVYRK